MNVLPFSCYRRTRALGYAGLRAYLDAPTLMPAAACRHQPPSSAPACGRSAPPLTPTAWRGFPALRPRAAPARPPATGMLPLVPPRSGSRTSAPTCASGTPSGPGRCPGSRASWAPAGGWWHGCFASTGSPGRGRPRRRRRPGRAERRRARVAALGFGELAAYLRVRRVEQGWPPARIGAELRVGRRWLRAQLNTLGLPKGSTPAMGRSVRIMGRLPTASDRAPSRSSEQAARPPRLALSARSDRVCRSVAATPFGTGKWC